MTNLLTVSNVQNPQFDSYIPSSQHLIEDHKQVIEYLQAVNPYENSHTNQSGNIVGDVYQDNIIRGTAGNDNLIGTAGNDVFAESAGNDTLDGGDGNDKLRARYGR